MAVPELGHVELVQDGAAWVLRHGLTQETAPLPAGADVPQLHFDSSGRGFVLLGASVAWCRDILRKTASEGPSGELLVSEGGQPQRHSEFRSLLVIRSILL